VVGLCLVRIDVVSFANDNKAEDNFCSKLNI